MLDLDAPKRPGRLEPVLPMVNLVFLLLIFFLIAAVFAPGPPVSVDSPRARVAVPFEPSSLRVSLTAEGELAYRSVRGPAVPAALAADIEDAGPPVPVALHADRHAPAGWTVAALRDLAAAGAGPVWLVVEPRNDPAR